MFGLFNAFIRGITNPYGWVVAGAVGLTLFLLGAPLLIIGVAVAVAFIVVGWMSACEACTNVMSDFSEALNTCINKHTVISFVPTSPTIEADSAVLVANQHYTFIQLPLTARFNYEFVKFSEWKKQVKLCLESGLTEGSITITSTNLSDNDWVLPVGTITGFNLSFVYMVAIKDDKGNIVKVVTGRPELDIGTATISLSGVGSCAVCGKNPNTEVDKIAREQKKPTPRKVVFVKIPSKLMTEDGGVKILASAVIPGWVPPQGSSAAVYMASTKDVAAMYLTCTSVHASKTASDVCSKIRTSDWCPQGPVYRPNIFKTILQTYGYVDENVIRIAKLMSNYIVYSEPSEASLGDIGTKVIGSFNPQVVTFQDDHHATLYTLNAGSNTHFQSKKKAMVFIPVPYSMRMTFDIPGLGSFAGFSQPEVVLDPLGIVAGTFIVGMGGVQIKSVDNKVRIPVITPCGMLPMKYDSDKNTVYVFGPKSYADAMANNLPYILKGLSDGTIDFVGCSTILNLYNRIKESGNDVAKVTVESASLLGADRIPGEWV